MATANLCKCINCGNVLIDKNPQVDAIEHKLDGTELEMEQTKGLSDNGETEYVWVCPICMVDDYLMDL